MLGTDLGKWVDEDCKTRYVIDNGTLARQGGARSTFYWVSEGMGCALTGHVSEAQLRAMAIDVCSVLGGLFGSLTIGGDSNP